MKVILLKDVKKVGKKDQIIEVSDGYAMNFLIPRKLAVAYNERNLSQLEATQAKIKKEAELQKAKAIEHKKFLETKELTFILAVGEKGKAFGTITAKKIEEEIKEKFNIVIDRKKLINYIPLKELGQSVIQVELYKDVIAAIKVTVKDKE